MQFNPNWQLMFNTLLVISFLLNIGLYVELKLTQAASDSSAAVTEPVVVSAGALPSEPSSSEPTFYDIVANSLDDPAVKVCVDARWSGFVNEDRHAVPSGLANAKHGELGKALGYILDCSLEVGSE